MVAGALAAQRCYVPDDPGQATVTRAWQGFAAGLVSGGVGALTVTVLGTSTTALMLKSAWVRDWLYHGQHLTASAVYGRELYAGRERGVLRRDLVVFPIIGLMAGLAGGYANTPARCRTAAVRVDPLGPGEPEPVPDPPDGGQLADADAGELTALRSS